MNEYSVISYERSTLNAATKDMVKFVARLPLHEKSENG